MIAKAAAAAKAATGMVEMGDMGAIPNVDVGSMSPPINISGLATPPESISTLAFLFAIFLFCVVAPISFVFCDSVTSRKIYAISIALSGLTMLYP